MYQILILWEVLVLHGKFLDTRKHENDVTNQCITLTWILSILGSLRMNLLIIRPQNHDPCKLESFVVLLLIQELCLGHLEISTSKFKSSNTAFSVMLEIVHWRPATKSEKEWQQFLAGIFQNFEKRSCRFHAIKSLWWSPCLIKMQR